MISIFVNLYLYKAIITGKLYIGTIIPQTIATNIGDENGVFLSSELSQ
jgi:hypothetical protein